MSNLTTLDIRRGLSAAVYAALDDDILPVRDTLEAMQDDGRMAAFENRVLSLLETIAKDEGMDAPDAGAEALRRVGEEVIVAVRSDCEKAEAA